ncbi:MAG: bifunctional 5,10-methylenetetrahydrofolate dehydrogenase/5,10-methenyltetrahydrofolate cyclohydrolase [Coriobacteriales bacterium]|jgi:methylenetetrahydrofolate dehydrogenase (NADP+)/methenyltetrahydrofolate cyclohydrolase|nr:bifunctional 5,10-methylenetetrahydrofolate dehydrogenase/5,10-methenyltetrahydrofolate cyclohydrolase [Coriobacteriales bacterium]
MTRILKGAEVVEALNARIAAEVEELNAAGVVPTLAIVRVGERGDDISYERGAGKRAEKVGVAVRNVLLPAEVSEDALVSQIEALNADASVHGVLLFRPLPVRINEERVRNVLASAKDVDGITDLSLAGVFAGTQTGFAPCTPAACVEILEHFGYRLEGKNAVVVGRSLVVGKPVAMMLLGRNATVTLAHSRTADLKQVVAAADIVIAAVGRAEMLNGDYLSEGQVVIDVGINVTEQGALVGDVDFAHAEGTVAAITPVPGGVGTVTTSVLMKQVVQAARRSVV